MNTTPTMNVDTKEYRSNHGAQPRGRGNWVFAFDGREDRDSLYACNDAFGAAKKRALAEAKRRGAHSVKVMS